MERFSRRDLFGRGFRAAGEAGVLLSSASILQGCAAAFADWLKEASREGISGCEFLDPDMRRKLADMTASVFRIEKTTGIGTSIRAASAIHLGNDAFFCVGHLTRSPYQDPLTKYQVKGPGIASSELKLIKNSWEGDDWAIFSSQAHQPNGPVTPLFPDVYFGNRHIRPLLLGKKVKLIAVKTADRYKYNQVEMYGVDLKGGINFLDSEFEITLPESLDESNVPVKFGTSGSPVFAAVLNEKTGRWEVLCDGTEIPLVLGMAHGFNCMPDKLLERAESFSVEVEGNSEDALQRCIGELRQYGGSMSIEIIRSHQIAQIIKSAGIEPYPPLPNFNSQMAVLK